MKKWDKLSTEQREVIKQDLISFFENELEEQIGIIAAEKILNFFLQSAGTELYNKGIQDAQKLVRQKLEELQYDLDDLNDF